MHAVADSLERDDLFGQIFNIGSTEEVTIMELAQRVRSACDSQSEIVAIPYDEAYEEGFEDMLRRVPDTPKLEAAIGWRRTRDLDGILGDVIAGVQGLAAAQRAVHFS